jgi:hypothetical protein
MEVHVNDGYGVVLLTNGQPSRELASLDSRGGQGRGARSARARLACNENGTECQRARTRGRRLPVEYRPYVGQYKNQNVEDERFESLFAKGQLMAAHGGADGEPLVRVRPALFKPAKPDFNPERYRFDSRRRRCAPAGLLGNADVPSRRQPLISCTTRRSS